MLQPLSASLLLHALLLGGFAWQAPAPPAMPQAKIRLVVSPGTGHGAATAATQAAPGQHPPAAGPVKMTTELKVANDAKEARDASGAPASVSLTTPAAALTKQASAPAGGSALAAHASGAAVSAGEAAANAPASSSATAREGASSDALREYRMALAIEARRFKRYPPLARERGWEGTVEAAVTGSSLAAPQVNLQRSSGYAALDEQTLDMVRRAAQVTSLPDALRGRDFRVVLPVRFSLDDDQ